MLEIGIVVFLGGGVFFEPGVDGGSACAGNMVEKDDAALVGQLLLLLFMLLMFLLEG